MKTIVSDLAQEVEGCFHALSTLKGRLVAVSGPESPIEIPHMAQVIIQSGKGFLFHCTCY